MAALLVARLHQSLKVTDKIKALSSASSGVARQRSASSPRFSEAGIIQESLTSLGGTTSAHDIVDEAALAASVAD